ncbi:anti-sigma factor family protein [Streptomyces sp. NPDC127072]|uniref:anti-sigma factor family protein n=1 Tax=Streptomyces sp. NPDC127072 TaxID=3347129 RepID=UPI003646A8D5
MTDTDGHPDVAEISDLTEGLLSPSRTGDIRRHLEDCPLCADVHDSLEEIRGLLGSLPEPARMPDDVAGRIDAALAAEALLGASTRGTEAGPRDDHGTVSRETSTAGAHTVSSDSGSSPSADRPSKPRAATGPGRAHRVRQGRRRATLIGTAFTAAALGLGAIVLQAMDDDSSGNTPRAAATQESGSTVTFSEGSLESQVADLLAKNRNGQNHSGSDEPFGAQSHGAGSGSPGVGTLVTPSVTVPACIQEGTGNSGAVLAAEPGTYNGTSVYLVVQPDTSDSTKVAAYIVDAACVRQSSTSPGKLLLTQSYTPS